MNYEVKLILTLFSRILRNSRRLRSKGFRLASEKTEKRDERGEGGGGGGGEGDEGRKEGRKETLPPHPRLLVPFFARNLTEMLATQTRIP